MDDIDEIIRLEREFIAAWNQGDAHSVANFYAEDGVRIGPSGDASQGRAEIEAVYARLLSGPMKNAAVDCEPNVRLLSADIAVARGPMNILRAGGAPSAQGYVVDIWKKQDGRWRIMEGHPKLFPAPTR